MHNVDYTPPILTVDSVVFQLVDKELVVLLIQRAYEPFKDFWALPGGYNPAGETTQEALNRILSDKAGISTKQLGLVEQLYTFDTVARDPRGHAVSVTYLGLGQKLVPTDHPRTQQPRFFAVTKLPVLAYDHQKIVMFAHERLKRMITETNVISVLMPTYFSLSALQAAYEAVYCKPLDKRNFRKKILSLDLIEETEKMSSSGAHRPARLYKFKRSKIHTFAPDF